MTITIPGLPPLAWTHGEGSAHLSTDGSDADGPTLTLTSRGHVDWIIDAGGNPAQLDATALVFEPGDGDFTLSARVSVEDPRGTFDAAVLVIYSDDEHWAKLCFEYSPQGEEMIVSVITNTYSDDGNSSVATVAAPYLRITRSGPAWALHHSIDGEHWVFVRFFRLLTDAPTRVGFLSQAPMADTCVAHFDRIRFAEGAPSDLRNGD